MKRFTILSLATALVAVPSALYAQAFFGPQQRIDVGRGSGVAANETTAATAGPRGREMVHLWNDWSEVPGQEIIRNGCAVSSDGGATWFDFLLRPPAANRTSVEGDPFSIYDHRTGTVWAGGMSFASNGGIFLARKDQGANTFQPPVMTRVGSLDKVWGAAGPAPGNPNSTNLYVSYNLGNQRSLDFGQTWGSTVGLGSGIGFLPRVGPQGDLYVAYWDFSNGMMMRRSIDGGATFEAARRMATRLVTWATQDCPQIPGNFRVPPFAHLAVDPVSGKLYCVYFDVGSTSGSNSDVDVFMSTSTDRGVTWTTPRKIIDDPNVANDDQFFTWIEVDMTGRLGLVYLDTRHTVQNDSTTSNCFADAYYAWSDDGGTTWTEQRLTASSFNLFNDGLNRSQAFVGDYMGMGYSRSVMFPSYISCQNGDPDVFTHRIGNAFSVAHDVTLNFGLDQTQDPKINQSARSDDLRVVGQTRPPINAVTPNVQYTLSSESSLDAPSRVSIRFELSCTGAPSTNVIQEIHVFNYLSGVWELADTRAPSTTDSVVNVNLANGTEYVGPLGEMKAQVKWFDRGTLTPSWVGRIDEVRWTVTP